MLYKKAIVNVAWPRAVPPTHAACGVVSGVRRGMRERIIKQHRQLIDHGRAVTSDAGV